MTVLIISRYERNSVQQNNSGLHCPSPQQRLTIDVDHPVGCEEVLASVDVAVMNGGEKDAGLGKACRQGYGGQGLAGAVGGKSVVEGLRVEEGWRGAAGVPVALDWRKGAEDGGCTSDDGDVTAGKEMRVAVAGVLREAGVGGITEHVEGGDRGHVGHVARVSSHKRPCV